MKQQNQQVKYSTLKTTWNNFPAGTCVRCEHDTHGVYRCWAGFSKTPQNFVGDIPETFLN